MRRARWPPSWRCQRSITPTAQSTSFPDEFTTAASRWRHLDVIDLVVHRAVGVGQREPAVAHRHRNRAFDPVLARGRRARKGELTFEVELVDAVGEVRIAGDEV